MKTVFTRALALALCALMLCSCRPGETVPPEDLTPEAINRSDPEEILKLAETCVDNGKFFDEHMMDESAITWYSYGAAAAGALRLCVERVLWLRGEGESFAALSEGSRFTSWDDLARLCPYCPFPWYCQGLILDLQGKTREAEPYFYGAKIMANYPREGIDYSALRDVPIRDLYTLRDKLRQAEEKIYAAWEPVLNDVPADPRYGVQEYLLAAIKDAAKREDLTEALPWAKLLVQEAPFEEASWVLAIMTAADAGDGRAAALWLYEGRALNPDSEKLGALWQGVIGE